MSRATIKATENKKSYVEVQSVSVIRAHEFESGDVSASIKINGIIINGVRIMSTKDGAHEFLAMPSRKGSDGKYYEHVHCPLCDEDTEKIIDMIDEYLNKKGDN